MTKFHYKVLRDIILVILLSLIACKSFAQYGFNGTNVPENLTPEVRQWIIDMHPLGDTIVMVFRNDKYESIAPLTDVNNVISLHDECIEQGRYFDLVYTFNTRSDSLGNPKVTIEQNFSAFNQFLIAGVPIRATRLGNEEYFKAAGHGGNWNTYWAKAQPIHDLLLEYPYPIIIPVADPANTTWNTQAANLINSSPKYGVDFHFYWGRNDLSVYRNTDYVIDEALIKRPNTVGYDDFYDSVYYQITSSNLMIEVMDWFGQTFPNKKMYITEWGAGGNPGGMGGAFGFEAANDWFLNQISSYQNIACICKFNGASITGFITPASKFDIGTGYQKRLSYYTLQNFYLYREFLPIHNMSADSITYLPPQGFTIKSSVFHGISGDWSQSSGACAWWANGSIKTYDLTSNDYENIPPMSYGYLKLEIEAIRGCMDKEATNYNPDAIEDDGSCVYPAPECYRKRWLFQSLPCREVKTNCNCSQTKL